jgi:hypothetical protein
MEGPNQWKSTEPMRRIKVIQSIRSSRGASLIQVIVILGTIMAASVAVLAGLENMRSATRTSLLKGGIQLAALTIRGHLNNNEAWGHTISKAAPDGPNADALSCLFNFESCCGQTERPFAVFDQNGALIYDHRTSAAAGLTATGQPCQSYPSEACPLRAELFWTPQSSKNGLCHDARIRIEINQDSTLGSLISTGSRTGQEAGLIFMRGQTAESIAEVCSQMGGVFDQTRSQCLYKMSFVESVCQPPSCDQTICESDGGTYNQIRQICVRQQLCPDGQGLSGFNSTNGTIQCAPIQALPSPQPCPPVRMAHQGQDYDMPTAIRGITISTTPGSPAPSPTCVLAPYLPGSPGQCNGPYHLQTSSGGTTYCMPNVWPCAPEHLPPNASQGNAVWDGISTYNCQATSCESGYILFNSACFVASRPCEANELLTGATAGTATFTNGSYSCAATACQSSHTLFGGQCYETNRACTPSELPTGAAAGTATFSNGSYSCSITSCQSGYTLTNGACNLIPIPAQGNDPYSPYSQHEGVLQGAGGDANQTDAGGGTSGDTGTSGGDTGTSGGSGDPSQQ